MCAVNIPRQLVTTDFLVGFQNVKWSLPTNCDTANGYTDALSLAGNSTADSFVVGNLVVDKLSVQGNSGVTMDINPTAVFYTLRATLLQ